MRTSRVFAMATGGVLALSLALAPAMSASTQASRRAPGAVSLGSGIGSFTPAAANPRLSVALGRGGFSGGSGFRFTPSAVPGSRRAVTVAVRARTTTRADSERFSATAATAIAPSAYNLGVSVGWSRFALSGDIARTTGNLLPGDREAVDLGLTYSGRRWSSRLQVGADRPVGSQPRLVAEDENYSLDLGGSYSLTHNLDVTGGVRYRLQRDRLQPIEDNRRDSQAVYIGTAFRF